MVGLTALLDANVLYAAGLRDFLLRLADRYLYAPLWSADIHAEWMRSLLADRPDLSADVLERTRAVMDRHFPEAVVTGYRALTVRLDLPEAGDRHVVAAAIRGQADVIVTRNLRNFPADRLASHALTAQHPMRSSSVCSRPASTRLWRRAGSSRGAEKSIVLGKRSSGRARTRRPGPDGIPSSAAVTIRSSRAGLH